ncbi:MAG: hypothetical protein JNG88_09570 [Phycisphaerales bacterium]|nr:hypothetical protein [Phycisphaerales bacterium]
MDIRRIFRKSTTDWDVMRARMLAETSAFITECMQHPELAVRIPTVPADKARFPRSLSEAFWNPVLED